jgi:predicted extracellular nuclease
VDVLAPGRTRRLFTIYVNHLKSKYTEAKSGPARELELKEAAERRGMQAETLIEIVERKQRPKGRYIVLGDMNDAPTSKPLESFKDLANGLKQVEERGGTRTTVTHRQRTSAGRTASRSPGGHRSMTCSTRCG